MMTGLMEHLFRRDGTEHGAVIGAAVLETDRGCRLIARRLFRAVDGVDYVPGQRGYRMLTANFVRRCVLECADASLAYLAVHNHPGTDQVAFSSDDMASHRRGYPALLDILDGPPVGALVFARRAVAGDIWMSSRRQVALDCAVVAGHTHQVLTAFPQRPENSDSRYDRQVRLFGERGQEILASQKVGVVGAGGAGSLINEYLARLGVGHLVVVDFDRLDPTNFPRVVGAKQRDLLSKRLSGFLKRLPWSRNALKVDIAKRVARHANPRVQFEAINGDVTESSVVERLVDCDAIFLAADSMQARLVVNALCHQYLIPVWQVGTKVQVNNATGLVDDVFSVVRELVPGESCLWCNQLVNPSRLAEEAVSSEQRAAQRYVEEVPAPSVITLNAVATAHAVNEYLFAVTNLQDVAGQGVEWVKYRPRDNKAAIEIPRHEPTCPECHDRLGAGPLRPLPVRH